MGKAAGERFEWALIGGLVACLVVAPAACKKTSQETGAAAVSVTGALEDFWPMALEPALGRARDAAIELQDATTIWRDTAAKVGAGAEMSQADAQEAFERAWVAWQEVEMMLVGPLGSSLTSVGGLNLRDGISSWPVVSACAVDQETVDENWDDIGFFEDNLVNVQGFDALEVLLFSGPENHCEPQIDINADGTWDALGEDGVAMNRSAYAVRLAGEIHVDLDEAIALWSADGSGWATTLATAGASGSPYETAEQGVNAIYDAGFAIETVVKDTKVGWQSGDSSCGEDDCSAYVESPWAGLSREAVAANLVGFRTVFTGGSGRGLDDLLVDFGQDTLVTDLLARLDEADAAAAAVSAPLDQAPSAEVEALYAAIKGVTDLYKGDVATALALEIPSEAAGDVD